MGRMIRKLQERRKALKKLDEVMSHPEHVVVIHYSCESFYDRLDGSSPRITSIAVANLETAQTSSFSIHQMAERKEISLNEISQHYDELERQMLDEFYDYVKSHSGHWWIHWNMRDIHYGFQAIAHRYKVLGGIPPEIHESQLVDLSRLLYAIYGPKYIGHPRLQKIVEKNEVSDKDFLTGADEAVAFENREYVKLHFSTLRKVNVIAKLARRADDGSLKTDSTWRNIYGFWPPAIAEWLNENWVVRILEVVFAIIGFVATVIQIVQWIS